MSIANPTTVIASGNTANLGTYDTAAVVLTAGRKYYLEVTGYRTAANNISSVTHDPAGTPLSFSLVTDGTTSARRTAWDTAGHRTIEIWEVVPGSTTASALIRIIWAASQSSCGWRLIEVASGFDTSGTTVQVVTGQGTTTAVALTMAAFGATENALFLFVGWGTGTANPTATIAPTESRTELGEHNDGERASQGMHYQNPNGSDTSVGATLSATNDWGAIGVEVKALTTSLVIDSDTGTLTDNRSLTAGTVTADTGALAEVPSLTAQTVNAESATVAEVAIANITQNVSSTDSLTVTDTLNALSAQISTPESGALTESATDTLAATTSDSGTLAEARLGNVAQTAADAGTATESSAGTAATTNIDAGILAEAQTASQAGTGGGPATDTESATLVEQAIAALLASVGDVGSLTDGSSPIGGLALGDSAVLGDVPSGSLALVTADVGTFTDAESIGGLPPVDSDTDAFTFGDEAVVSYRFPPPNKGTRLHRHGGGTWLHAR